MTTCHNAEGSSSIVHESTNALFVTIFIHKRISIKFTSCLPLYVKKIIGILNSKSHLNKSGKKFSGGIHVLSEPSRKMNYRKI